LKEVNVLGYAVCKNDLSDMEWCSQDKIIVNTINPHSYVMAKKDGVFKKALKASSVLLPDGLGMVLAAAFLKGERIKKNTGSDLHAFLLEKLNIEKGRCFYFGASENTITAIGVRLKKEYSNINFSGFSPPYKDYFDADENNEYIKLINSFSADVLFVGMTAPKQEKWVFENRDKINARIICSVGAVFDFYAQTNKRPSEFWVKMGLEWLIRFLKEPRRLFRRNFVSSPIFLFDILKEKYDKYMEYK
jgi:N-acetylglucosaminyldiphosphoundecaprenol N-acetyl-beta-D-mannosaminyltransferase